MLHLGVRRDKKQVFARTMRWRGHVVRAGNNEAG